MTENTGDATSSGVQGSSTSRHLVALAVFLLIALAAGGVGSLLQGSEVDVRYLELERPAWAPPSWAFGVVWPVLYVLIGIAGWRLWIASDPGHGLRTGALGAWAAQLVLNAAWPGVFFGVEAFGPAIAAIVALDTVVIATIALAWRVDRLAALLLVPYLLWIGYATALNIAIWALN